MRAIAVSLLALACLTPATAQPKSPSVKAAPMAGVERNAYRHGGTYHVLEDLDPRACQLACNEAEACVAWSHVQGDLGNMAHIAN